MLVTENADGSHTVTIGDRSWTLPAKREQAGKVVNVRTYLNLRTGPGTDYTVVGRLLNGAEVKVLEESNGWYKVVVPEQTGYVYLDEDEAELRDLTDSALQKLSEITNEDFAELELVPDFDTDE